MILPPTATSLTILTSTELAPTPVTVPERCPFKTNEVPIPPTVTPPNACVIPAPTTTPEVSIPLNVWSAIESIVQTFNPLAHVPGFFAA